MSEDLIEKVAKALWDDAFEGYGNPWIIQGNRVQEDYRGHARAALAAIEESGIHLVKGWQPIETAPKDGTDVLLGAEGWVIIGSWFRFDDEGNGRWMHEDGATCDPTHWQPLPSPPEVKP